MGYFSNEIGTVYWLLEREWEAVPPTLPMPFGDLISRPLLEGDFYVPRDYLFEYRETQDEAVLRVSQRGLPGMSWSWDEGVVKAITWHENIGEGEAPPDLPPPMPAIDFADGLPAGYKRRRIVPSRPSFNYKLSTLTPLDTFPINNPSHEQIERFMIQPPKLLFKRELEKDVFIERWGDNRLADCFALVDRGEDRFQWTSDGGGKIGTISDAKSIAVLEKYLKNLLPEIVKVNGIYCFSFKTSEEHWTAPIYTGIQYDGEWVYSPKVYKEYEVTQRMDASITKYVDNLAFEDIIKTSEPLKRTESIPITCAACRNRDSNHLRWHLQKGEVTAFLIQQALWYAGSRNSYRDYWVAIEAAKRKRWHPLLKEGLRQFFFAIVSASFVRDLPPRLADPRNMVWRAVPAGLHAVA